MGQQAVSQRYRKRDRWRSGDVVADSRGDDAVPCAQFEALTARPRVHGPDPTARDGSDDSSSPPVSRWSLFQVVVAHHASVRTPALPARRQRWARRHKANSSATCQKPVPARKSALDSLTRQ